MDQCIVADVWCFTRSGASQDFGACPRNASFGAVLCLASSILRFPLPPSLPHPTPPHPGDGDDDVGAPTKPAPSPHPQALVCRDQVFHKGDLGQSHLTQGGWVGGCGGGRGVSARQSFDDELLEWWGVDGIVGWAGIGGEVLEWRGVCGVLEW